MSKKKGNMFDTAAEERKKEQAALTEAVTGRGRGRPKKEKIEEETNTPDKITLSMSAENKLKVKRYALEHGTTVSDLVQEWILKYC